MSIGPDEITRRFGYHPATPVTRDKHMALRMTTARVAGDFDAWLPDSREKSLALTALQEALMWANAAVACEAPLDLIESSLVHHAASESAR